MTTSFDKVFVEFLSNPNKFIRKLESNERVVSTLLPVLVESGVNAGDMVVLQTELQEMSLAKQKCATLEEQNRDLAEDNARLNDTIGVQAKVLSQINKELKTKSAHFAELKQNLDAIQRRRQDLEDTRLVELKPITESIKEIDAFLNKKN